MTQNKGFEVIEGRTELLVPHLDGKLTYVYSFRRPEIYENVQEQITQDKLTPPTAAEVTSLVHAAWQNPDEKYSAEIIERLRKNWLWCFTGNLYIPNKGVYIQDIPKIKKWNAYMDESELVKKLESKDPSVRFVPFGFRTGKQSALELVKNLYVIGLVGEEGAEKLAEVSDKYKYKPCVWSFENVDKEIATVTDFDSFWGCYSDRLYIYCDCLGGVDNGFAFGIQR